MNSLDNHIAKHTAVGTWCAIGALAFLAGCAYFDSPDIKRGDQHLTAGNWEEASLAYENELRRSMKSEDGRISKNISLTLRWNSLSVH